MRAELQGCGAIAALVHPPVEVALSPRSTDRQPECFTLSQTWYQITFSAQDQVGHVLAESSVPSQSLDSVVPD